MLPETIRLFANLADASESKGEFQETLDQYESAILKARSNGSTQLSEALLASAEVLYRMGRHSEVISRCREALQLSIPAPFAAEAYNLIGICSSSTHSLEEGEDAFNKSADLYRQIGDKPGLARELHNLAGCVYIPRGKFHLALWSIDEAQVIWSELGASHWGWHFLRASIHMIMGNYRQARRALDEIIQVIEPATKLAGGYYYLWARLAIEEDAFEQASEYIRLGLRIATQTGASDLNIWMRIEQSRFYRKTGLCSTALEWAQDAVKISRSFGFIYYEGISLIELARVAWENKNENEAFFHIEQAVNLLTQLKAHYDLAYALYLRALWQHQSQNPDASGTWCQAASAILDGDFAFILEKEQELAFPLIAAYLHNSDHLVCSQSEKLLSSLAHVPPQALHIIGLGQFRVSIGRHPIPDRSWWRRKTGELFRLLLLQPNRTASKDLILDALWPEHPVDSGTALLHQSTSALRRILEPDLPDKFPSRYLQVEGEQITLQLPQGSSVDFEILNQTLPQAIRTRNTDRLQEALRMYAGDLFPTDRYLDWSVSARTRLSELFQEGLLTLASIYFENYQYADALDTIRQILKMDPWNEDAVLIAMKTYIELGAAPHAIRVYNQLSDSLKSELGLKPRSDLHKLAESIHNR
jgi:DNA-binding SARP family transcriptional activator